MGSLSLLLLSSMVICSASSDSDSSIVWLPLSVRDSLLLNFFILSVGCGLKNSASAGTAGSGPAGAQSERADAGPVVADAPRRLRLRPPPTPQPRAFRSARAAGRLTRGRAPRSTWLPGRGASRTAQYSRPPSRGGARRRGAGCRTAGRWVDRSRRSRSSECALLSLARRLRLDASACSLWLTSMNSSNPNYYSDTTKGCCLCSSVTSSTGHLQALCCLKENVKPS